MKANKLREVINSEGITSAVLARESGIAPGTIARYLDGNRPKEAYISKIVITINKLAAIKKYEKNDIFPD